MLCQFIDTTIAFEFLPNPELIKQLALIASETIDTLKLSTLI